MEYQHRYNERCNPMDFEKHQPKKDLRPASIHLQQSWNLSRSDYLCTKCRKQLLSLKTVASTSTNVNERSNVNETSPDLNDVDNENDMSDDRFDVEDNNFFVTDVDDFVVNNDNVDDDIPNIITENYEAAEPISGSNSSENLKTKFNDGSTTRTQKV